MRRARLGSCRGTPRTGVGRGHEKGTALRQDGDCGIKEIGLAEGRRLRSMGQVGSSKQGREGGSGLVARGLGRSRGTALSQFPTPSSAYSAGDGQGGVGELNNSKREVVTCGEREGKGELRNSDRQTPTDR